MSSIYSHQYEIKSDGASEISESWVDLEQSCFDNGQKSLQCFQSDEMERLLREAQREGSTPTASRGPSNPGSHLNSPPRPQSLCESNKVSPRVSGNNSPSGNKAITPLQDVLPELPGPDADATWIWDWSSKPVLKAPEESQFKHYPRAKRTPLSLRNTEAMKHDFFSREFLQVFIPSIIVTNLIAFGIGVYVGKRLMAEAPKST